MKNLMALVLSVGLVLLGTTPVMAAGVSIPNESCGKEVVVISLPDANPLDEELLNNTNGDFAWELLPVLVGGVVGGYEAYKACNGCSTWKKAAATYVGTVGGMVSGAYAGAADLVAEGAEAAAAVRTTVAIAGEAINHAVADRWGHFVGHSMREEHTSNGRHKVCTPSNPYGR